MKQKFQGDLQTYKVHCTYFFFTIATLLNMLQINQNQLQQGAID